MLAAIQELGGYVELDKNLAGEPIVSLALFGSDLSDAGMIRLLEELPVLTQLNLRGVLVGDALVSYSRQRDKLTSLSLRDSRVTDAGLIYLAEMTSLEELDLSNTRISDAGLKPLAKLAGLQALYISETRVTEQALLQLQKELPNCSINQ